MSNYFFCNILCSSSCHHHYHPLFHRQIWFPAPSAFLPPVYQRPVATLQSCHAFVEIFNIHAFHISVLIFRTNMSGSSSYLLGQTTLETTTVVMRRLVVTQTGTARTTLTRLEDKRKTKNYCLQCKFQHYVQHGLPLVFGYIFSSSK